MSQDVGEGIAVRRSLAILRRLRRGPASKEQLITAVLEEVGAEAYPESETARQAAFKHDKAKLRTQFGVDFTRDPREDRYVLNDAGPYGYVELSPMARQALRVLSETFDGAAGQYAEIRALLDELTRGLAPEARRDLDRRTPPVELDIQQGIDPARLNERVWKTVTRAVQERRKLAFNYISPQHDDRQPRYHEVAPLQIRFQRGHWYLYLYDLLVRSPDGSEWRSQRYFHLRLQYIQDDERLLVLPGVLPAQQRAAFQGALPIGAGDCPRDDQSAFHRGKDDAPARRAGGGRGDH